MSHRANILASLRRRRNGRARHVLGLFAVAYLSAGVLPCVAASEAMSDGNAAALADAQVGHEGHGAREGRSPAAQHGHEAHGSVSAAHDAAPASAEKRSDHCPHCSPSFEGAAALAHGNDHSSCAALEGLTDVAASHAKDTPPPVTPPIAATAFTLPPPLASPLAAPPLRAVRVSSVPLNVRHCVFLI